MQTKRTYFGTKSRADLSDNEKIALKQYKERFSKWHNKQIDFLTFSINLIFTISIAVSGFIISNSERNIFKGKSLCETFSLTRTSLCLLAFSTTLGIIAIITRLNDFRLTKNTIMARRRIYELKNDIKYEDTNSSDLEKLKAKKNSLICCTKFLGTLTWILFYFQIGLLILTIWIIVLNV